MRNTKNKILLLLLFTGFLLMSCQRNYYSGKIKNKNCGCPAQKGMGGF